MKNLRQRLFAKLLFPCLFLVTTFCIFKFNTAFAQTSTDLPSLNVEENKISDLLEQLEAAKLDSANLSLINEIRVRLGKAYSQAGRTKDALRILMTATESYQSSNQLAYASTLHLLGNTWQNYGGVKESILTLAKSVTAFSELGNGYEEELADATLDLARANLAPDLLELALIHAKNALAICETKKPAMMLCTLQAQALIGDVNMEAGDFEMALKSFGDIKLILNNIPENKRQFLREVHAKYLWAQSKITNTQEARLETINAFENMLHDVESTSGHESLAVGLHLNQITQLYLENGQSDLAINAVTKAIKIIERHQGITSMTLLKPTINYAHALYQQEKIEPMLAQLIRALSFSVYDESLKNSLAISDLFTNYSQKNGNTQAAVHFSKRTAEIALYSGRALRLSNPKLGRNYLANRIQVFRKLIHNLLEQNRLIEAQDALDLLKENEYLDFIGEVGDEMRTAQRNEFEENIRHRFNAEIYSYFYEVYQIESRRLSFSNNLDSTTEENKDREELPSPDSINHKAMKLKDFLQDFFKIFQLQKSESIPPPIQSLEKATNKMKSLLQFKTNTATLQYFVTDNKLHLLLGTAKSHTVKQLEISESQLQRKINALLFTIQSPTQDPLPKAKELHQLLIQPIELKLQQLGIKTILISPDGILKKVPFAALHNGSRYLVQDYDTALLTQSSWIKSQVQESNNHRVGAFGLTTAVGGLRALPGVKRELFGIVRNKTNGIFLGEVKLDRDFNENNLSTVLSKKYSILHIASHFVFRTGRDTDSFLVLGDGSTLSINQLKQKRFDFSHSDLIVLSACDTAKYDKNLNGIPVDGLANVLQMRGAKTVLATQWAIEDKSTSILMPRFYQNLANKFSKIEALGLAQRSFIEKDLKASKVHHRNRGIVRRFENSNFYTNPKRPYAHPYYWAGFLLMGSIH